jgi:hypothetical protein
LAIYSRQQKKEAALGLVVDYRFSGKVLGGLLLLVMVVGAQESKQLICLFGGSSALRTHMELRLFLQLLGGDEQII